MLVVGGWCLVGSARGWLLKLKGRADLGDGEQKRRNRGEVEAKHVLQRRNEEMFMQVLGAEH